MNMSSSLGPSDSTSDAARSSSSSCKLSSKALRTRWILANPASGKAHVWHKTRKLEGRKIGNQFQNC